MTAEEAGCRPDNRQEPGLPRDFTGDGDADHLITTPGTNAATFHSWFGGDGHGGWIDQGRIASGVPVE